MSTTIRIEKQILPAWLVLLSFVVLQKIAVPIENRQFSICLFAYAFFVIHMVLMGKAKFNVSRIFLLLCFLALSTVTFVIVSEFSILSYCLFILIYSLYLIEFDYSDSVRQKIGNMFEKILIVAAILGVIQLLVNAVFGFYLEPTDYLPESWCLKGFNTYYPLWYKAEINKSNGFFFLEPSFFSQFMTLGMIYEIATKKRIKIVLLFAIGLAVSFSGTGLLLLFLFAIPMLSRLDTKKKILTILLGIIFIAIYLSSPLSESITKRVLEIFDAGSSAAGRFSNPLYYIVSRPISEILFGSGSGSASILNEIVGYRADMSAFFKVIYEYGVINAVVFFAFIINAFFRKGFSVFYLAIMVFFLFLSGSLLQPVISLFSYFIVDFLPANNIRFNKTVGIQSFPESTQAK